MQWTKDKGQEDKMWSVVHLTSDVHQSERTDWMVPYNLVFSCKIITSEITQQPRRK
jgi:hypothetical protein